MRVRKEILLLTVKGTEELRKGTYQFDVTAKNILALIEQGASSTQMVLQRSMFPHNVVMESLHRLVRSQCVAVATDDGSISRTGFSESGIYLGRDELHLKLDVAVSQARFRAVQFLYGQLRLRKSVLGRCDQSVRRRVQSAGGS